MANEGYRVSCVWNRNELELLAKDQDSMHDPLGIASKRGALRQERAEVTIPQMTQMMCLN